MSTTASPLLLHSGKYVDNVDPNTQILFCVYEMPPGRKYIRREVGMPDFAFNRVIDASYISITFPFKTRDSPDLDISQEIIAERKRFICELLEMHYPTVDPQLYDVINRGFATFIVTAKNGSWSPELHDGIFIPAVLHTGGFAYNGSIVRFKCNEIDPITSVRISL